MELGLELGVRARVGVRVRARVRFRVQGSGCRVQGHRPHGLRVGGQCFVEVVGKLLRAHVAEARALPAPRWGPPPRAVYEAEVEQRPIRGRVGVGLGLGAGVRG